MLRCGCARGAGPRISSRDEMRCPCISASGRKPFRAALSVLLRRTTIFSAITGLMELLLSKGAPMDALFAELYGKHTGATAACRIAGHIVSFTKILSGRDSRRGDGHFSRAASAASCARARK